MAFNFGGTPSSAPAFGFATPLFGAQSSAAFGAAPAPAFGAGSTPAFGGASPAFGASPAPAFGAKPGGLFGSTFSTPPAGGLFGQPPAAQPAPQAAPAFGTGLFGGASFPSSGLVLSAPQTAAQPFGQAGLQQPAQQAHVPTLITTSNTPLTHSTKWDDIHPDSQKYLLELEKVIMQFREEGRQLDQSERLKNTQQLKVETGDDERVLSQTLQALASEERSDSAAVTAFRERVLQLLRDTETAMRALQRSSLWRETAKAGQGQVLASAVRDQLNAPVVLPSTFLRDSVRSFQEIAGQYAAIAGDLERLLPLDGGTGRGGGIAASALEALPAALANAHDVLFHVAARLERLHERVAVQRDAALTRRHAVGQYDDPFEAAARRELESTKASARRIAATPAVGAPAPPATATAPPASLPLLAGPPANFAPATAPAPGLFAAPAAPLFGAMPSGGLSAATPAFSSTGLFGAATPAATSTGLFGASPTAAGGLFGSGGSFGATTAFGASAALNRQPSVRKGKSKK